MAAPAAGTANPWLIAVVVALAVFMEVLDTTIANVALPYIAGGLGVSLDEERVWKGRFVSDAAVSSCVKAVRKALVDEGRDIFQHFACRRRCR